MNAKDLKPGTSQKAQPGARPEVARGDGLAPGDGTALAGLDGPAKSATFTLKVARAFLPRREFVKDVSVVVRDGVIAEVLEGRAAAQAFGDDQVVEAPRSTLLPGLVDCHVHLSFSAGPAAVADVTASSDLKLALLAASNAQKALARGVTTVADCGARGRTVIELREAVAAGLLTGPRILAAGAPITTTAGHCAWLGACADSADEVIKQARRQVAAGADFLKVMMTGGNLTPGSNPQMLQYPEEAIVALVAEARRLGRPLVAHAHSEQAVAMAARAGVSVVAHATCQAGESIGIRGSTLDVLAASGVYVDPTITVGMPPEAADPALLTGRSRTRWEMLPIFAEMHKRGVPLLAGTDSGVPEVEHGSAGRAVLALHRDLSVTLEEAIAAATEQPAHALGLGAVTGSIAPGRKADLVLLGGNLNLDPSSLLHPSHVWSEGRLVARDGAIFN